MLVLHPNPTTIMSGNLQLNEDQFIEQKQDQ
jgi:hypothetical protein